MFLKKTVTCLLATLLFSCANEQPQSNQKLNLDKPQYTFAQQVVDNTVGLRVDSQQINTQDLAKFASEISNVRILALGEQTHGAGSVFSLKVDLIKYLHQEHDFDLFILESGLYDVEQIYQQAKKGQRIKNMAPGNIFYMYANSDEVTPLFDYINEQANTSNPLILVGFDSQHTGALSNKGLVPDLTKALATIDESLIKTSTWQLFSEQIQQVLNGNTERYNQKIEQQFFERLDELALQFSSHNKGFWLRITKGLIAQAKRQWKIEDNRSKEMGENINWWASQYPDKKIIVWAHTWHLTKIGNEQVNAGEVVSQRYQEKYFMAHFTGEQGHFLDFISMGNKVVSQLQPNSIEALSREHNKAAINFINMANLPLSKSQSSIFANDYQQTLPSNTWNRYWDGVFILKEITPATYNP